MQRTSGVNPWIDGICVCACVRVRACVRACKYNHKIIGRSLRNMIPRERQVSDFQTRFFAHHSKSRSLLRKQFSKKLGSARWGSSRSVLPCYKSIRVTDLMIDCHFHNFVILISSETGLPKLIYLTKKHRQQQLDKKSLYVFLEMFCNTVNSLLLKADTWTWSLPYFSHLPFISLPRSWFRACPP